MFSLQQSGIEKDCMAVQDHLSDKDSFCFFEGRKKIQIDSKTVVVVAETPSQPNSGNDPGLGNALFGNGILTKSLSPHRCRIV